jgi:hypothetical protein
MEKSLEDLAIFGGNPSFNETLHVGRPNIGSREKLLARINDMLDRHWLTNRGPFVSEFEQQVAELLGVKHCIAMCNGTVALEIAVRALYFYRYCSLSAMAGNNPCVLRYRSKDVQYQSCQNRTPDYSQNHRNYRSACLGNTM